MLEKFLVTAAAAVLVSHLVCTTPPTVLGAEEDNLEEGDKDFLYGSFPQEFLWGASSTAFQVEGGWDADGRSPSIWDTFTRRPGLIENGDTGRVACDSYNNYKEDVKLLRQLGVSHYRFSISWSRVLPDGVNANQGGINYYKRSVSWSKMTSNNIVAQGEELNIL
ncbi:lactase-phlorizin hydrolase [Plakobranchus ocellatus]|uniref:Lactase-phlorizin hydrolase n=1 Tax=Plakobranchus ocellatus TaxID=259542 RepID=A0AAV4C7S0_9GAST|nr:lactase-phlorizin hydrolase [Plakobranchus ocellatus]